MLHRHRVKAQGLPITVIIIAALGLIVLAILIGFVYQKTARFGTEVGEAGVAACEPSNEWKPLGTNCEAVYGRFSDQKDHPSDICCRKGTAT